MAVLQDAAAICKYTTQLQQHAESDLEGDARADALAWVNSARAYVDRIDPLHQRTRLPEPPEPTPSNLAPFMGRWSPYGPS